MNLATATVIVDVGRSLREALFMFYETFWPLVLGFGLSGLVQASVSRAALRRQLGDHRPGAIARATGFGMISSSCSYAASAMAKSLFARGADFVATLVFMIASTNLVVELGVVLVVLLGWPFVLGEFVGGFIMIVVVAALGALWLRGRSLERARAHLSAAAPLGDAAAEASGAGDTDSTTMRQKLRSRATWADGARYALADLTMLRRELVIGYLVAGTLSVAVPTRLWSVLFFRGHGTGTLLENVVVAPFIAILSFVCSIGNVPLAAALWRGGISFGGVVAFLFADLITLPLLLIYRRYYGAHFTGRLLAVMWSAMSLAGLLTDLIFRGLHLVPAHPGGAGGAAGAANWSWNATAYLNLAFAALFVGLVYAARHQRAWGGGAGYAIDPVCGMQVEIAHAPATRRHDGVSVYFCSDHCAQRYSANPARYADGLTGDTRHADLPDGEVAVDPVCGMSVARGDGAPSAWYENQTYYFCSPGCAAAFRADAPRYLTEGPIPMDAVPPVPTPLTLSTKPRPHSDGD